MFQRQLPLFRLEVVPWQTLRGPEFLRLRIERLKN
jgi:hypothetical protein